MHMYSEIGRERVLLRLSTSIILFKRLFYRQTTIFICTFCDYFQMVNLQNVIEDMGELLCDFKSTFEEYK